MCRHLAYLGPPLPLSWPLFEAPHSLDRQSFAPADARGPTVNADGFGLGWFVDGRTVRLRRTEPLWTDPDLPGLAASVRASAMLLAVRAATPPMPVTVSATAPFTDGRNLFSLNGFVDGWPDSAVGVASRLSTTELLAVEAPSDAALLWALLRHRLAAGDPPATAVAELYGELSAVAPASRLNLLFTDGSVIVATTRWHSLWTLRRNGAVTVASEPLDPDPDWLSIPDSRLVVAGVDGVDVRPLPTGPARKETS